MEQNEKYIRQGRYWFNTEDGSRVPVIEGGNGEGEGDKGGDKGGGKGDPLAEARADAAGYRRQLRELEKKYEGIDPDATRALMEEHAANEQERQKRAGEFDKLLEKERTKHKTEMEAIVGERDQYKGLYESSVIDTAILSASGEAIDPSEVTMHMRHQYNMSVVEGKVAITNKDGTSVGMDVAAAVAKLLGDRPHLQKAKGGGGGSNNGVDDNNGEQLNGTQLIARGLKKARGG